MFIEPVFGKKFFGREEVLGTLKKRVTSLKGGYRQNIALTGPMLAGKSSILRHFLKNIDDSDIIPLYIDMGEDDFKTFCIKFSATLLYYYLKSKKIKAPNDFEEIKKICKNEIPVTIKHIENITKAVKKRRLDAAYKELLETTSIFKKETGKSCIVILDEFHNLSNFHLKKPFQVFGKYIMVQKNTMYIVASSQKTLLKEILSKKLSLLFGNFEIIDVNGFDNQTAKSFVSDKIKESDSNENIQNYLIQATKGNPFYLEVLSKRYHELYKNIDEKQTSKDCLLEAFADLLYKSDGVLNQYFTNNINFFLEKKTRKKYIPILLSLAKGKNTIKTIQKDLEKRDKDLGEKLQRLLDMDLIINSGIFYMVSDKLFEYWLKSVYSMKSQTMIDDMDIKYLEFKQFFDVDYNNFLDFSTKNIKDIISSLFKSFDRQKMRININCRIMPEFDSVETYNISNNISQVNGSFNKKKWVCRIKEGDLTDEADIYDMKDFKLKRKENKIARKIFIPLKGIEQNAFLLAKEHNIWVWDVEQLNEMLRFFGKFEIVL